MGSRGDGDDQHGEPREGVRYRRILLKLSGEALLGNQGFGVDPQVLRRIAGEVAEVHRLGVAIGIVVGGGNIFRGVALSKGGSVGRVTGDHMGMLATVMNALAFHDALEAQGVPARVLSAISIERVAEPFDQRVALEHLDARRVLLLAAGTGNPFFTTDTAAALRAAELGAEILCKATKVDGIYDRDPMVHHDATFFAELTYREVLERQLKVMDATAISLCMENRIPIAVLNLLREGSVLALVRGERVGSLVKE
ncbi:MAG: UMP kinase [Acidobacteria bacterium]|nr:UMP kinase [Acidobacteriota bacterium]